MRSRPTPRVLVAIAVSGLLLGAAGCTSSGPDTSRPTLAKATAGTVTVADASDAAARSVRVSKALFASAPGAIVATAGDADAISDAAKAAASAHVPVLLTAKKEQDTKGGAAVARELDRLGADWYQAEGDVSLDTDVDERKAPEGGDAPESTRASRQATVVVADASADAAAVATAKAAGARVVTMPRGVTDPAAAPDVVTALHERAKHPTVLVGAAFDALQDPEWTVRAAEGGFQLRNGGQRPFDGHRYVALYGAPGAPALGVLGEQGPEATVRRAEQVAKPYRAESDELVTPAMEVIATVAAGDAGADGDYSTELPVSTLEPYVDAAHDADMPVIIDLQPGRSDFLSQAKKYESLLKKPGVWLALDPEWRLTKDQVPLAADRERVGVRGERGVLVAGCARARRGAAAEGPGAAPVPAVDDPGPFRAGDPPGARHARARRRAGLAAGQAGDVEGAAPGRARGAALGLEELLRRGHAHADAVADHAGRAADAVVGHLPVAARLSALSTDGRRCLRFVGCS